MKINLNFRRGLIEPEIVPNTVTIEEDYHLFNHDSDEDAFNSDNSDV